MNFDPYLEWLDIPPEQRPPNYYELLGLPLFEEDANRIYDAALERSAIVNKYKNGDKQQYAVKLGLEIAQASACLQNLQQKRAYDERLRGNFAHAGGQFAHGPIVAEPDSPPVIPPIVTAPAPPIVQTPVPIQVTPPRQDLGASAQPSPSAPRTATIQPRRRRNRDIAIGLLGGATLCVGALLWFTLQTTEPGPTSTSRTSASPSRLLPDVSLPTDSAPVSAGSPNPSVSVDDGYNRQLLIGEFNRAGFEVRLLELNSILAPVSECYLYRVSAECVQIIEFASPDLADFAIEDLRQDNAKAQEWVSAYVGSSTSVFRRGRLLASIGNKDPAVKQTLTQHMGPPVIEKTRQYAVDAGAGLLGRFVPVAQEFGRPGTEINTGILNQQSGTLAAWIKPYASPRVRYLEGVIDADRRGQAGTGFGLNNGHVLVILDNEFWATKVAVRMHEWQHVALTFDASEAMLYQNGRLANYHSYTQGHVSVQHYMIGRSAANSLFFQGLIQDARIYDRVLGPEVIDALAATPPQ